MAAQRAWLRFTGLAFQMGAIIGGMAWLGTWLDKWQETAQPYYTIVFSLTGVGVAMYLVIKELKTINDEE